MTEITKTIDELPKAIQDFILHWGDMGSSWGVNRTVTQIHALLFIWERPLNAEEICQILGVARSNVSNSLKELLSFKTIRRVPVAGDRRDYFTAETDVWEIAKRIAAVRKAREIDPALEILGHCVANAQADDTVSGEQFRRIKDMYDFTASMDHWYGQMQSIPAPTLNRLVKLGDKVVGLLKFAGGGRRKTTPENHIQ